MLSEFVNGERLWDRHGILAQFGATTRGGVNRRALTNEDTLAKRQLLDWVRALGGKISVDAIGNIFCRLEAADSTGSSTLPLATGSHLDTQPTGGRFDGIFGVLAGLEVLESIRASCCRLRHSVDLIVWMNEEGCRFAPSTMGSAVRAGALDLDVALKSVDEAGIKLDDALSHQLDVLAISENRPFDTRYGAYVEAHIEQGPILETTGKTIGVVSGIQALAQFTVTVIGEEAHAGTTPRAVRHDAMTSAAILIHRLREATADEEDLLRFTVGKLHVYPGSINVVPSRVTFTVDVRHPLSSTVRGFHVLLQELCAEVCKEMNVEHTIALELESPAVRFDTGIRRAITTAANNLSLPVCTLVSGATHDAKYMVADTPTGMIFVPCEGGVSHAEHENATPEDLCAGARVLADTLYALSTS